MTPIQLIEHLNKCYTNTGKLSFVKIPKHIVKEIKEQTSFLPIGACLSERIYCIKNNITFIPTCMLTHTPLKWNPSTKQYNKSYAQSYINRKPGNFNFKQKYTQIKDKLQLLYKSHQFKQFNITQIKDKLQNIHNINITPVVISRDFDLWCNVLHVTQFLPEHSQWGERLYCIKNNITAVLLDRYGVKRKYINSTKGYSTYGSKTNNNNDKLDNIKTGIELQNFQLLQLNHKDDRLYTVDVKCNVCGNEKRSLANCGHWKSLYCDTCCGVVGRSKIEEDICTILTQHNINFIKNDRTIIQPKELDIFIPSHNIAIEVNGILWHSVGVNYPNTQDRESILKTHSSIKHQQCYEKGIQLLTIFDNEWLYKQDIIKSVILAKLGIFKNTIYARKCTLHIINGVEANKFYEANHIQGGSKHSTLSICLKYDNEIVCCMSFGMRKITSGAPQYELIRFCSKQNTNVIGGGSKIFKHALKHINVNVITSFCDKRYGGYKFYARLGFELVRESPPNYWYTLDCKKLLHRSGFQKHKISTTENKHLTEKQIMLNNGYRRIYDCGNYVFKFYNKQTI